MPQERTENLDNSFISWDQVEQWSWELAKRMDRDGVKPDILISIIRGGLAPSTIISDYFEVKNLYGIKIEHWGITKTASGQAMLKEPLYVKLFAKNVLIVDDICNTGQSLQLARDQVMESGPKSVRTATLLASSGSAISPDYFLMRVTPSMASQIIFPWNGNEYLAKIIFEALKDPMPEDALIKVLERTHNARPPERKIKETIAWLLEKGRLARQGAYLKQR